MQVEDVILQMKHEGFIQQKGNVFTDQLIICSIPCAIQNSISFQAVIPDILYYSELLQYWGGLHQGIL